MDEPTTVADLPSVDAPSTEVAGPSTGAASADPSPVLSEDVLVEEVSIDGMCGVY